MSTPAPAVPLPIAAGAPGGSGSRILGPVGVSYLLASATALAALVTPGLRHWYVLPVTGCGLLIGIDVARWLQGRLDTFDPQALVALFGLHFCYLAPLLHVVMDYWPRGLAPHGDWRDALGAMALLNLVGLLGYRLVLAQPLLPGRPARTFVDRHRFIVAGLLAVAVSMTFAMLVVARFGGPAAFLSAVTVQREDLAGAGWLLLIAEAFPFLAFAVIVVRLRAALADRPVAVAALLVGFAAIQFLVGGLRGSRGNTIWPILMALLLVHLLVRRISRRAMLAMALLLGAFMYFYGLYKGAGVEALGLVRGERSAAQLTEQTGRGAGYVLLGDLGRADIQALVLDRYRNGQLDLAFGGTYVGDLSFMVPSLLWPEPPADKVEAGTDALYGRGTFAAGYSVSRIYGLAGEALLNFGPAGAVVGFALLGWCVRAARRSYLQAQQGQQLRAALLAPMGSVGVILLLGNDLDNLAWFTVKMGLPLLAVVAVATRWSGAGLARQQSRTPR